jgi:dolichyl-phosphate beta-glucosyltransferase
MIIVDDASIDRTADVFLDFENKCLTNSIFVLKLRTNMGKGGAVRSGVLCSRGKFILFCDADGATK